MIKPDLRDLHIYGGMIGVAVGVLGYAGWQGSLIAVGAICWFMGVYRMGRL
jgi:hypothetical protein